MIHGGVAKVSHRISSYRLEQSLGVSIRAQKTITDQLSVMVGIMTSSRKFQDESPGSTPALKFSGDGTKIDSPSSEFNQTRTATIAMRESPTGSPRFSEDRTGPQQDVVQNQSHPAEKQQCKALCSCVCHTRSIIRSPWTLETIIGKINVQYAGWRPACNEYHCRRSAESWFNVVYRLPKYVMNRYISMTMQYTSLSGPEFLLRMPRMVSWSHLLWNYANNGHLLAIQKLFAEGKASPYDLNPRGSSALNYAVGHNRRLFQFLLDQGAAPDHPNDIGRTPSDILWEHSFAGNFGSEGISIVGSMLKDTGHAQTQGFSTLHKIILGIVSKDLESELETSTTEINIGDSKNRTPLYWAAIRSDSQAVKTLLTFGANPNVVDRWGHTPLDFARNIDICKMLLDAGVNTHACNGDYGRSVLHQLFKNHTDGSSSESDTVDMIDLLVDAGIDVDVRDSDGETPLLNAIFSGRASHARRLIELGANFNASNFSSRDSAIHFAVAFDRHETISLLLERGADYTALNADGHNIAHVAARSAGTETISVLAKSKLVKLDVSVRCKHGKTPAEYLSERSIMAESEQGLHAEFEKFMSSIPMSEVDQNDGILGADEGSDSYGTCHFPGAYPAFADPSLSF